MDYSHIKAQQQLEHWINPQRRIETYRPKRIVWTVCRDPHTHRPLHEWHIDAGENICLWCNQRYATSLGRLVLEWLHPDLQRVARRLIEQEGRRIEEFLLVRPEEAENTSEEKRA